MAREILTDYNFKNVSRIVNLPEASEDGQPVVLSQLKAYQDSTTLVDGSAAIDGSIPIYNSEEGKFLATSLDTKLTLVDGGNF